MKSTDKINFLKVIEDNQASLLKEWVKHQLTHFTRRQDLISEEELEKESLEFLNLLERVAQQDNTLDIKTTPWQEVRLFLEELSKSRGLKSFSPSETATFIFSLKYPLFEILKGTFKENPTQLFEEIWQATQLLDQLGLYTTESYIKTRETVIKQQQEEMLELSTPVIKLWEGILALPMIGTLDSNRTQVVMENLLEKIVTYSAEIAIIDITGVPHVDTLVAQHLLKTVTAARLMGADCIISGIRPQIAQTIVQLGVSLEGVITKASLADAFLIALTRINKKPQKERALKA